MIPVTKPFLPPRTEYEKYIDGVWKRNWLTNNGPLVNELELRLKDHLAVDHLLYVTNGNIALQLAIKALELSREVITTPFSYVATTSSLVWENCKPVFVDIQSDTLNIDPSKIEEAITDKTSAIIATHVFGIPCDVEAIETIAKKYNLKVIYDAAHAFGVAYKGKSLFTYGDISTTSFHATKLFHTIEGGAVMAKDAAVLKTMAQFRNFGHLTPTTFAGIGINAKNSEFHAAMGLTNLGYIDGLIEKRKSICDYYDQKLKLLDITRPVIPEFTIYNYAYYPVIFKSEKAMLKAKSDLQVIEVFTRRYFYPSLSSLSYVEPIKTPICDDIASRILCLPLYPELEEEEIDMIARHLLRLQNYG